MSVLSLEQISYLEESGNLFDFLVRYCLVGCGWLRWCGFSGLTL